MTTPRKPNLGDGGLRTLSTLVDTHGKRLDGHDGRLDGHDGVLDGHAAALAEHHDRISALEKVIENSGDGAQP